MMRNSEPAGADRDYRKSNPAKRVGWNPQLDDAHKNQGDDKQDALAHAAPYKDVVVHPSALRKTMGAPSETATQGNS